MAKQRMIDTRFWDDNYTSNLDPIEKLVFLYCLTNTHTNISGVYEIPLKSIASDTGIDKDMLLKILIRFENERKIIYRDGWIAIINFIKYQNQGSPKVKAGIEKELQKVPKWLNDLIEIPYIYPIDTLSHSNSNSNLTGIGTKLESELELNIDSSIEEGEQALKVIEEFGDKEINNITEVIKGQVEFLGLIYKKGSRERERAKNILTGKDFGQVCEKANMSRIEFCKSIIYMSSKLDFWNGKIYNSETLYKHYAQVYNEAVNLKAKKQKDTSLIIF